MYIDMHWLYLLAGLVVAGLLYPWSVKRFGQDGQISVWGKVLFLVAGVALAWPLALIMFVGDTIERRGRIEG